MVACTSTGVSISTTHSFRVQQSQHQWRRTPIQKHWNIGNTLSVSPVMIARLSRSVCKISVETMPPTNKYVVKYTNWFSPLSVRISRIDAHCTRAREKSVQSFAGSEKPAAQPLHWHTFASKTEKLPKMPDAVAYKNGTRRYLDSLWLFGSLEIA